MLHKIRMGMTPDYLLGMIDSNGQKRPASPIIFRGDADLLKLTIEACPHKRKFTSGLLMDEKSLEELGGRPFLEQLCDDFQQTMFPDMPPENYVMIFVIHPRLDQKLELNYCVANMHVPSGKSLKPYYHKIDLNRFNLFVEQQNLRHGMSNPNDYDRRRPMIINSRLAKNKHEELNNIHAFVEDAVEQGSIVDRESLIESLKKKYEVNREGKDYVSVRTVSGNLYRLKGAYYFRDFEKGKFDLGILGNPKKARDRLAVVNKKHEQLCSKRADILAARYKHSKYSKHEKTKKQEIEANEKRQSLYRSIITTIDRISGSTRECLQGIRKKPKAKSVTTNKGLKRTRRTYQFGRRENQWSRVRNKAQGRRRRLSSDYKRKHCIYMQKER